MLTKKHFNQLAQVIADEKIEVELLKQSAKTNEESTVAAYMESQIDRVERGIMRFCEDNNPAFDRQRFSEFVAKIVNNGMKRVTQK